MAIVYQHKRKDNNEIFYIGISKKYDRAYSKKSRNQYWKNIVNKYDYFVEITHENICWEEACVIERYLISFYGRYDLGLGKLVNMTDGGDFSPNYTKEVIKRMIRNSCTPEAIAKRVANSDFSRLSDPKVIADRIAKIDFKAIAAKRDPAYLKDPIKLAKCHTPDATAKRIKNTDWKSLMIKKVANTDYSKILPILHSEESKNRSREAAKKRRIPILQYDLQNNFIREWSGCIEIEKELNYGRTYIRNCCNDISTSYKGFIWKWKYPKG